MKQILVRAGLFLAVFAGALGARACPLCDTGTGREVRAGIFNADFGMNILVIALPFLVLLGVVALLCHGVSWLERPTSAELFWEAYRLGESDQDAVDGLAEPRGAVA